MNWLCTALAPLAKRNYELTSPPSPQQKADDPLAEISKALLEEIAVKWLCYTVLMLTGFHPTLCNIITNSIDKNNMHTDATSRRRNIVSGALRPDGQS